MDVLFNDYSVCGQFTDDVFEEYMREDVLPIMEQLKESGAVLLKEYETYAKYITKEKKFIDYIHERGNPIWDKFRICLLALSSEKPFWNDDMKTRSEKEYICEVQNIPNCFTEAYERNGILMSFRNSCFDQECILIRCDGKESGIHNFSTIESLKKLLKELGLLVSWEKNSFFVPELRCKFEIRFQEDNHNKPYFHLTDTAGVQAVSLSIPDADVLAGSLSNISKAISWSLQNMRLIMELWNRIHPEKRV